MISQGTQFGPVGSPDDRSRFLWRSLPYVVAVTLVLADAVLGWWLDAYVDRKYVFSFFLLAVVASAYLGGTASALTATGLGWVVATYFFIEPRWALLPISPGDAVGSLIFLLLGVAIAFIAGRMGLLHRRAERQAAERAQEIARLAENLRVSERFALVGTLTAGVGHDITNILFPMRTRLQSVQSEMERAGLTSENVKALSVSSQYLADLARGLSYLVTDPSAGVAGQTNLAEWCAEIRPLLRAVLPRQVELACELPRTLPAVAVSPHALSQVVFNAVQNAGKAIGERPARVEVLAEALDQGRNVRIIVRDTGPGMNEEALHRLTQPAITPHAQRGVSGMGFPLMRSIVQRAGGFLEVKSKQGAGTDVCLTLPAANRDGVRSTATTPADASP